MKKMNKKGFTLIELLAVIVVLAIIMVIATQQINKTIKQSRADSFLSSAKIIKKNAELLCTQDNGSITVEDLSEMSNLSEDYTLSADGNEVILKGTSGEFKNLDTTLIDENDLPSGIEMPTESYDNKTLNISLPDGCTSSTSTSK